MQLNQKQIRRTRLSRLSQLLVLAVLLLAAGGWQPAQAQWTTSGNNISNSNTGNVGIGTTGVTNGRLTVQSAAGSEPAITRFEQLQGANDRGGYLSFGGGSAGGTSRGYFGFGRTGSGAPTLFANELSNSLSLRSEGALHFGTNGDNIRMTLATTGNIGIGTTNPDSQLHVDGAGSSGTIRVSGNGLGGILFKDNAAGANAKLFQWRSEGGLFRMALLNDAENTFAQPNLLVANAAGNVGFGTASPSARVDVNGAFRSWTDSQGDVTITHAGLVSTLRAAPTVQLALGANGSEALRINTAGNVGIGTSLPSAPLDVRSSSTVAKFYGTGSGNQWSEFGNSVAQMNIGVGAVGATSGVPYLWSSANNLAVGADGNPTMVISGMNNGNVGIGTSSPTKKLDVAGDLNASGTITGGNFVAKYQDVAEWVESSQQLAAGTVVSLDPDKANQVLASVHAYDTSVAGVISARPGIVLGEEGASKVLVATTGRVKVKVDATRAAIKVGDLLVTSEVAGVAMKSTPVEVGSVQLHRPGTLIGKALEPLAGGIGEILVLLSLQ